MTEYKDFSLEELRFMDFNNSKTLSTTQKSLNLFDSQSKRSEKDDISFIWNICMESIIEVTPF